MKALLSHTPGGPETLTVTEHPDPVPGPGQILVAVKACGVNYPDVLIIEDKYQFKPDRPFAPGAEIAGVVETVGAAVTGFQVGDRVIGQPGWGGMAEKIVLNADRCLHMPDRMPFDQAAAFILTYGTSYHALKDRAGLRPGETLLVLGAAGGVGLAAVELGKAMGARVIAAVSSEDKAALAREHGADATVIYPRGPFDPAGLKDLGALFKKACGPNGADVIYDPVGGDYAEAALRAIAWEGRFLVVGFPAGIPKIPLNLALLKGCQIVGVFWGGFVQRDPAGDAANNRELLALYEAGKITPVVSERYTLEQGPEAIVRLSTRAAKGKIVVVME
ncbi:MAG TPA: NADPH:quinone oxidoreductase family protein [Acetobacteraceae bacterium]|nr:NADPH:quinone oxidoreductase family protein [Acetobacteraceae bacterium]